MVRKSLDVLDHGFVSLVDTMGDDSAIVQAARVSYGDGTKTSRDDEGLIRYLMRNWHTSPIEMCEIKFHIKAPIFVARQFVRHRTAGLNEISGRYSIIKDEFYVPDPEDMAHQSSDNKQGRGALLSAGAAQGASTAIRLASEDSFTSYELLYGVDDADGFGLARELARVVLPLNTYTEWYWKIDLHNLFHFLKLRMDPHAQLEIRRYAYAIANIVQEWVPIAYRAFEDYRLNAVTFSAAEMAVLGNMLGGRDHSSVDAGLSTGEQREFMAKMDIILAAGNSGDDNAH